MPCNIDSFHGFEAKEEKREGDGRLMQTAMAGGFRLKASVCGCSEKHDPGP